MDNLFGDASGVKLNRIFNSERVCKRCDVSYIERSNIGRWRCTAFHPLSRFATTHDPTYSCCDRPVGSTGCVRADHTDSVMLDVAPKTLSRQDIITLGLDKLFCANSWVPDGTSGGYVVHRVDKAAYETSGDPARVDTNESFQSLLRSPLNRSIAIM